MKCAVKYNGICSRAQNISVVPDLHEWLANLPIQLQSNIICKLYDTVCVIKQHSQSICPGLYDLINRDLDNLTDWFRANKLSLNTIKTHYMYMLISPNREIIALNQNTIKIASDGVFCIMVCDYQKMFIPTGRHLQRQVINTYQLHVAVCVCWYIWTQPDDISESLFPG